MRLDDLIKELPPDTEQCVEKARKRFNVAAREILRQETGLRLNRPGREQLLTSTEEVVVVPITVVPGMPQPLKDMKFNPEDTALLLLGQHRTELLKLQEGLPGVRALIARLMAANDGLVPNDVCLDSTEVLLEWIAPLLEWLEVANPAKKLLAVNEDVLGAWYSGAELGTDRAAT